MGLVAGALSCTTQSEYFDDAKSKADHQSVVVNGHWGIPEQGDSLGRREEPDMGVAPLLDRLEPLAFVDRKREIHVRHAFRLDLDVLDDGYSDPI